MTISIYTASKFLSTLSLRRATSLLTLCLFLLCRFLSTLSLRRATTVNIQRPTAKNDFYPRSPCGERRQNYECFEWIKAFLSTLSLRRATAPPYNLMIHHGISIHALLAESDPPVREIIQWEGIFLSTLSLRRATCITITTTCTVSRFLSTLSLRRATPKKTFQAA